MPSINKPTLSPPHAAHDDASILSPSGHEDWPKVVEAEESSLAESLFNLCLGAGLIFTKKVALAAKKAGTPKTRQVKISACSEPSRGPEGTTDVIVYPEVCCGWGSFDREMPPCYKYVLLEVRRDVAACFYFRSRQLSVQGLRVAAAMHTTSTGRSSRDAIDASPFAVFE